MKQRIEKIIKENSLSASQFADKIGVPRSGLSHVLKGRNKPSLDYVLKILEAFPQIDSAWLLTGKQADLTDNTLKVPKTELYNADEDQQQQKSTLSSISSINKKISENKETVLRQVMPKQTKSIIREEDPPIYGQSSSKVTDAKVVDKIVFFFSDGSFEIYKQ